MPTIYITPDRAARCWTATMAEHGPYPAGTYPLPFTIDAPVHVVAAALRKQFPGHRVTGVSCVCVGCGE